MHIDWEYLRGVADEAGDWEEAQLEELYQVSMSCPSFTMSWKG